MSIDGLVDDATGLAAPFSHTTILNKGTNTHPQIDAHIASGSEHPWAKAGTTVSTKVAEDDVILDGDLKILSDTKKLYLGIGDDLAVWYDGTVATIDAGDVSPSDLDVDCGANKTLRLVEAVYDDWQGALASNQLLNPSAHIVNNDSESSVTFRTNCDTGDYVYMNPQMQHAWELGTDIHPHLHWWQTTAALPNWLIQYRWQRNGQAKTIAWTDVALTVNAFTYVSGTLCQITNGANITPPSGYSISDILQFRVIRDVANSSGAFSGAETGSVDAEAMSFDYHFQRDTLGSRQEYIK